MDGRAVDGALCASRWLVETGARLTHQQEADVAKKHPIKPSRVEDPGGNAGNTVDVVKLIVDGGDTIQFENERLAKALIVFGNGTLDLTTSVTTGPLVPVPIGTSLVVPVPAGTVAGGTVTSGKSVELTVAPATAGRLCSRHYQVVFVDDFNPPDQPKGGSQNPSGDPEIIINP